MEHPRINRERDTNFPKNRKDYITQVSKEIEGRVTRLSEDFSRTDSRSLDASFNLDEFGLNPQYRVHSGPTPEAFQRSNRGNQGTIKDCSKKDLYPEMGVSLSQSSLELSPEETSNIFVSVKLYNKQILKMNT